MATIEDLNCSILQMDRPTLIERILKTRNSRRIKKSTKVFVTKERKTNGTKTSGSKTKKLSFSELFAQLTPDQQEEIKLKLKGAMK